MSRVLRFLAVCLSCAIVAGPAYAGTMAVVSTNKEHAKLGAVSVVSVPASAAGKSKRTAAGLAVPHGLLPLALDDDIPGVSIPDSPINGQLDSVSNTDDVYSVYLDAGQTIDVSMGADPDTTFYVDLYAPGTTTVVDNSDFVDCAGAGTYDVPGSFSYSAPTSGTYYVDAYAASGSGAYTIDYSLGDSSGSLTDIPGVSIPDSPISGALDSQADRDNVYAVHLSAGQAIQVNMTGDDGTDFDVYLYPPGTSSVSDDEDCVAYSELYTYPEAFTYVAPVSGTYYLDAYAASGSGSYELDYRILLPATVYTAVAPSSMSHTRSYTVYAYLKPRHTAGTYPVRIYKYRYVSGKWKSYGYVKARASNYSSYTKCSVSVKLPYTGKWRLRAYAPADGTHYAVWSSGYRYVTVK
jgi:hypothetical protein